MFFRITCFLYTLILIFTCALCQQSSNKFPISLLVPLLFKWIPLWSQWYLGFTFELFIKQIFLLSHSFFTKLKSLVLQCRTLKSGVFDIVGCMYDFMLPVVAPLKCFVTNLLFLSDNSHPLTSITIESPKIMVPVSFFWCCFQLSGWFLLVSPVGCFWFWLSSECNVLHDDSVTCKSSLLFWLSSLTERAWNLSSWI